MAHVPANDLPIISDLNDFDYQSGTFLEKLVFNNREVVIGLCVVITLVLGYFASQIELQAGFEKMLPQQHSIVQNYNEHREDLKGLGNSLRVVLENKDGDIYNKQYLDLLEKLNSELFFIPGVSRTQLKSLWTPNTRWRVVTEAGFEGGQVMPGDYDGSDASIAQVRVNIARAAIIGDLVANNHRSSAIIVPLLDFNPETGEKLDYGELTDVLNNTVKDFLRDARAQGADVDIHIIGFAKLIGDLLDGMLAVISFFVVAVIIASILLYWYTRDFRATAMVIFCTITAVVWQLGILHLLGYALDPFSILVPFLVFAIGVSHGAQKLNGVLQDLGRGTHKYVAARYTFRRLFLAGVTALLSDGVGFAVLMIILIQVIQDLAITASIGVTVLIFTNLILTPVALSYMGAGERAIKLASRPVAEMAQSHWLWRFLLNFTERRWATAAILVSIVLFASGYVVRQNLQIGDLDPGAPELRVTSKYNRDVAFNAENFSVSSDIFAVIVKTEDDRCTDFQGLSLANELEWRFRQLQGVDDVRGLNVRTRSLMAGINEGFPKWLELFSNQDTINYAVQELTTVGMVNVACSVWPMMVYLKDHKAATLTSVLEVLEQFNEEYGNQRYQFLPAAGSSGFEAATNIVVREANARMLFYVYGAVILLCLMTFRSVTGVICAVVPLMLTSVLCEALMVMLGIGVKVATLPVIALGVGIGVDYALYVLTVILAKTKAGVPLKQAYFETLNFTGKVVALIGVTLAAGVITWAMSPIKFQADMGILLTFMFIWNMFGALILMPALAHFLIKVKTPADES